MITVKTKRHTVTKELTINGLFIALVFIATMFINIRLPISINGGLIHLGNVPLFIAAIVFGEKKGAVAGALGMGLFDVLSGWVIWAPFTFIIRGIMGYIIGIIAKRRYGKSLMLNCIAIVAGAIWMIVGYYFAEVILYGNFYVPLTSIAGNVVQIILASIIALPLVSVLKKLRL